MQKFYTLNLYAVLITCGGLALWLVLACFSSLPIDSRISLLPVGGSFLTFLLLNSFFYLRNKERCLRLPQSVSERAIDVSHAAIYCLCIAITAYGFYSYPSAPIKPDAGSFTDKAGHKYTYQQFRNFQKWEVAYMTTWTICALSCVVFMPFYDTKSKKFRFQD